MLRSYESAEVCPGVPQPGGRVAPTASLYASSKHVGNRVSMCRHLAHDICPHAVIFMWLLLLYLRYDITEPLSYQLRI